MSRGATMDCSYVLRQGIGRALLSPLHGSAERWRGMIAQGWGRGLLDVGDQALMRGFVPHVRVSSGAAPRLRTGVDVSIGHLQSSGIPLPRLHPRRCAMFVASFCRIPPRLRGVSQRDRAPIAMSRGSMKPLAKRAPKLRAP
jgi:hypothetical protein